MNAPDQIAMPFTLMAASFENDRFGIPTMAVVPAGESTRNEYSVAVFAISTTTFPLIVGTTHLSDVRNASFGST